MSKKYVKQKNKYKVSADALNHRVFYVNCVVTMKLVDCITACQTEAEETHCIKAMALIRLQFNSSLTWSFFLRV